MYYFSNRGARKAHSHYLNNPLPQSWKICGCGSGTYEFLMLRMLLLYGPV
jgi:hypothetical protein